ncbi:MULTISPECIES: tetratricopeptide repeat protein [Calothrix]|uniref:Tetratricopeptide repeat protein n=2 Tax=Calothrix TaxID=1186 RepID=A0ABR8AEH1_9CYAN|nr:MULTISPECIES: tetratricopeptide repeat protein [Calothrix]MBD2197738.1 tetratricopeptide repeat protein [Calothrix parietina FACHB-288]MBD2226142.1 tetratricopeptide repeat protein [Calothrix anomala FACHB-343]
MARVSYGDDVKTRVKILLESFLAYANYELENRDRFKIDDNWETPQQVIVRTQLRVLGELSGLTTEQVRDSLNALKDFLKILEDLREHKQGSADWHFRLKFWHDKSDKYGNLQKFDAEWQSKREELPGVQREKGRKAQLSPTRYENIPLSGVTKFVGRERELQELHRLLQENQQVALIAAIAGMGGVGKTELALQYANSHRVTYQGGICWLSALQNVGVQLVQFARTYLNLNLPEDLTENPNEKLLAQVKYCCQNWCQGEVLLVIDNVTNYRDEVGYYLESVPSRFKQLITTREKLHSPIVRLDLDVLTPLAAMQLLKSIIGEERLQREALIAEELCQWLGYLPLGLELVGRYLLGDEELTLAEMLQDLENERLKHQALEEVPQEMKIELGVAAAFELSWRRLRENAQRLGCLLSLFALAPIPWDLVESVTINNAAQDWKKARRELLQLHLLQPKGEGMYQLHPLLREFFQDKLTGLEQREEFKRSFCRVMVAVAKNIPYAPTLQQIKDVTPTIPHIAEVANNLFHYVSDDDLIWPFIGNAWFYSGQGLYDRAIAWCKQCLAVTQKLLGEEHLHVATSFHNLGRMYLSQGHCNKAERLYLQALNLRKRLLIEENLDLAQNLNDLAFLYFFQGRYKEAEPLDLEALNLRKRLLGEENLDVAQSLNNLALLYSSKGRYKKAEPLYLQALNLRKRLLGEENLDVAQSLNNLALFYKLQEKYNKAESLYQEALRIQIHLLGDQHHTIATTLNNLAGLYESQGKYSEAEPLYKQALELQQHRLGEEHPNVAQILNNLAVLYNFQGKYSEAETLFIQAVDIFEQQLGVNHPNTVTVHQNLADLRDRLNSQQ